jgi:DNA-binding transcriptional regulator YiaG
MEKGLTNRNLQFFLIKQALGMSNQEIADAINRPYKTVEGWSGGVAGKNPPQAALDAMKAVLVKKIARSQRLLEQLS